MRAGQMNRRVSIRAPGSTARSTDGEPIITWTTVLSSVWADTIPIEGRELFSQDSRYAEVTTRFVIRWSTASTAILPKCRVVDHSNGDIQYDIKAVIDIGDQRRGLEILAARIF